MERPQLFRFGIIGAGGDVVGQNLQRPVGEIAGAFQTAHRRLARRQPDRFEPAPQQPQEGACEPGENQRMQPAGERRQGVEQHQHHERRRDRDGGPQRRPQRFPEKREPRPRDTPGDARAGLAPRLVQAGPLDWVRRWSSSPGGILSCNSNSS